MFAIDSLSGSARAVALVGAVLLEAIVLYVGYGGLEQAVGERIVDLLRGE
ncbi:DUF7512 family protein [Natrinema caseinilyticum]|nr:hypothetical protein [Natrinema caseinilyticum]